MRRCATGHVERSEDHVGSVIGLVLPAEAAHAEACGMHSVMADRSPAVVVRRVEVAARVAVRRVGELEVEAVVAAHGGRSRGGGAFHSQYGQGDVTYALRARDLSATTLVVQQPERGPRLLVDAFT